MLRPKLKVVAAEPTSVAALSQNLLLGVHVCCKTYSNFHSLSSDKLHAAHDILLHLHELGELLGQVWAKGASGRFAEGMS